MKTLIERTIEGLVVMNAFARRQTPTSPYGHFEGTEEELCKLVSQNLHKQKKGYRDGVVLVPVPVAGFFTSIVPITSDSKLLASFEARRPDEESHVAVRVVGRKTPAKSVEIVLYAPSLLAEDGDESPPQMVLNGRYADDNSMGLPLTDPWWPQWEIISINPSPIDGPVPMDPTTMTRNALHLKGGTQGTFTAEEFAKSVYFWSQHAMVAPQ